MKSVKIRYILAMIALLAGSNLRGETLFVTQFSNSSCNALHILTVYQQESEIIVTKYLEKRIGLCMIGDAMLQAIFEMNFPSIALREVDIFDNLIKLENIVTVGNWQVLYQNGVVENSYNPDWGDGWVDTRAAGYVNIKRYPWIYHPDLGWLKVTEGDIVILSPQSSTSPKALSFYLYSADYGWLWTSEFTEKYHSFADGIFKTVEEITGG